MTTVVHIHVPNDEDPLGYDEADVTARLRHMAQDALDGVNDDAVEREAERAVALLVAAGKLPARTTRRTGLRRFLPFGIGPIRVQDSPEGLPLDFISTAKAAGIFWLHSHSRRPEIRLHNGRHDFYVPAPDGRVMCISTRGLPDDGEERARAIMERLAYGFLDPAARELVARHNREVKLCRA